MKYWRSALHWVFWTCLPVFLQGQTVYFFQDSNNPGYYDSGLAFKTSPSLLAQSGSSGDKIPVDYNTYYQGTNALKLNWTSKSGGDWAALVIAPGFPFQDVTGTDTLAFWAYSKEGLEAAHWPLLYFEGAPGTTKSRRYALSGLLSTLPAGVWTHIKLPLSLFRTDPNQTNIDFSKIKAVIFGQDAADGQEHTLYLDDVKTYRAESGLLAPPTNLRARGYDSHVELRWQAPAGRKPAGYRIWRSGDGGTTFEAIRLASADTIFIDFTGYLDQEKHYFYKVTSVDDAGQDSESSNTELAVTRPFSDEELMEMVQQYTFRYFWDFAHPVSGLARERNTSGNTVTSGGSGFGIMAILVAGVSRGVA